MHAYESGFNTYRTSTERMKWNGMESNTNGQRGAAAPQKQLQEKITNADWHAGIIRQPNVRA